MKYAIQPAKYNEPLEEFLESFDDLKFLLYKNLTGLRNDKDLFKLMETNLNPRVWLCDYAGEYNIFNPQSCNLFRTSMTNDGFGYTFNNANFWDIYSRTNYTETFAKIMQPKGLKEDKFQQNFDENDEQWVYPKNGIRFPFISGPSGKLEVKIICNLKCL